MNFGCITKTVTDRSRKMISPFCSLGNSKHRYQQHGMLMLMIIRKALNLESLEDRKSKRM